MRSIKIKSEKREELARKATLKQNKGGTLAGQISRTRVNKNYTGSVKKLGVKIKK